MARASCRCAQIMRSSGGIAIARTETPPITRNAVAPTPCSECSRPNPDSKSARACRRATARKPPLLFVHGGYCDAWCWEPYFLPWFARAGLRRARAVAARPRRAAAATRRCSSPGSTTMPPTSSTSLRELAGAAGADRPLDGRGGRRAACWRRGRCAARRCSRRCRRRACCRWPRGSPPSSPDYLMQHGAVRPDATVRATCWRRCARSISATTSTPRSCARRRAPQRRIAARAARPVAAAALAAAASAAPRRCSCWAPRATASATPDDVSATARHHGVDADDRRRARAHDDARARNGRRRARRALAAWLDELGRRCASTTSRLRQRDSP